MSWLIESWAVPDGCAFGVHRKHTDSAGHDYDPPDHVIYVCPPHFVPTPTGYATALAAARGRFQEKFANRQGDEVAFETLDQLIELVRRAYLAANAGGAPPQGDAPLPIEPGPHQSEMSEQEEGKWTEAVRRLKSAETADEREQTASYLSSIWTQTASNNLKDFCKAVLDALAAEAKARLDDPRLERDIRDFALLSVEMNDWVDWQDGADFMRNTVAQYYRVLTGGPTGGAPVCWPSSVTDGLSRSLASGLLERLPSPNAWQPYEKLVRLGDHLAAAMSDRGYLRSITSFGRLLPLIACALAMAAAESYRFRTGGPFHDASSVRSKGFRWLARELPSGQLDGIPMAGDAIRQVLDMATSPTERSRL